MEGLNICMWFIKISVVLLAEPAYHPTGLMAKKWKIGIIMAILADLIETWYGVFKWKNSTYAHYLSCQTSLPPNQPTSLKVKNVHNFVIFQPIYLKLGMETQNGRT